jgi:hypothetical protein
MCSTLFDVKLDTPFHLTTPLHHNERTALINEHAEILKPRDLVIGDRGYFSYQVCSCLKKKQVDTLFRVKERACKEITFNFFHIFLLTSATFAGEEAILNEAFA